MSVVSGMVLVLVMAMAMAMAMGMVLVLVLVLVLLGCDYVYGYGKLRLTLRPTVHLSTSSDSCFRAMKIFSFFFTWIRNRVGVEWITLTITLLRGG